MKALIVYCHPNPESFNAAIRDAAIAALTEGGHEIRLTDLYAEGFDPVMSRQDRLDYHTPTLNEAQIGDHLANLLWCEALIFIYPTWWYGPPAMLKGWLDRVWVPHATFAMPERNKPITGMLTNITSVTAISTLGSPWWWWKVGMGEPGRKILLRGLPVLCAPGCRTKWLALHRMDSATDKQRAAFLARVRREVAKA
jgi:NAD(P)H dehydrogenase (quinone)